MATGQDILDLMEVLFPELQLQTGEVDVTKGLLAVKASKGYLDNLLALQANLLGDGVGTVATVNDVETTAFPTGVLRIDRLQFLDPVTSKPVWDLTPIRRTGGHIMSPGWPANVFNFVSSTGGGGKPVAYFTDGSNIYWTPRPDGAYNIRWYGFAPGAAITAAGTLTYPPAAILPLATFAVKLIRVGLDDPVDNYGQLAKEVFEPLIMMLGDFKKEEAPGYNYKFQHSS